MWIGLQWRSMLEGGGQLGNAVLKELESLIASVTAWSNVEHDDDGTHTDVTATSVTITQSPVATALKVLSGLTTLSDALDMPGIITPAQITSDQNNYSPISVDEAFCLRLSTDASRNITGLQCGTNAIPIAGRLLLICNIGSSDIVLKHESASSTDIYRFLFPSSSDITLTTLSTLLLYYDSVATRWIALGGTGSGGGTTPHDLLSTTHPDTDPASPVRGDIIRATASTGNAVDSSKYWFDGQSYIGLTTILENGSLKYWADGKSILPLPPPLSGNDLLWRRYPIGPAGYVLTSDGLDVVWAASGGTSSGIAAKAYRSTDLLGLVDNSPTAVPMTATEFDNASLWASGDPAAFTVTTAGVYSVCAQGAFPTNYFGWIGVQIYVNGTKKAQTSDLGVTGALTEGDYKTHQVNAILSLSVGDRVEFRAMMYRYAGAANYVKGGQTYTWFSIAKVGG